jgi:hypothetical protein
MYVKNQENSSGEKRKLVSQKKGAEINTRQKVENDSGRKPAPSRAPREGQELEYTEKKKQQNTNKQPATV